MGRYVVTSAEAWRLAQAREYELSQEQGREPARDESGKIKPPEDALAWVDQRYAVLDPDS